MPDLDLAEFLRINSAFDDEEDTERSLCESCGAYGSFPYTPNHGYVCFDCLPDGLSE